MFFYRQDNWEAAAKRFVKLGSESYHSPFLGKYLTCLFNLREYPKCFELAWKAIAANPAFDEVIHDLSARCAFNSNDLAAAEKLLDQLVRHNTRNLLEHQKILAQVYLRLDDPDKAFALLKKAHAKAPNDMDVLLALSFVAPLVKLHKEAVSYGIEAVKAAPKNARSHMALVKAVLDLPQELKINDKQRDAFQRSLEFLNKDHSGYVKAIPIEKDLNSFLAIVKA